MFKKCGNRLHILMRSAAKVTLQKEWTQYGEKNWEYFCDQSIILSSAVTTILILLFFILMGLFIVSVHTYIVYTYI